MVPRWFSFDVGAEKPRVAFPGEPVMRPLLDARLDAHVGSPVNTRLLVDSGSEYTMVTKAFARRLGITGRLSSDYAEPVLIGGATLLAELATVSLEVPDFPPYEAIVGFVGNWNFAHSGVLGQRGFFDRFGVLIDRVNLRFGLIPQGDLDSEFSPGPEVDPSTGDKPPFRRGI